MRYPPHLLDEIRARLPVSSVVSRRVPIKKKGREWAGLSPFKVEKTPSFFVNDQKGFYHCFASGEHGDIFKFLMTTEGLSFPEAVERLAAEAGVALPKPEARDEAREDQRRRQLDLMEAAARFFEESLAGPSGVEARRYVERRGLDRTSVARFRIGFAPGSRHALKDRLAKAGFTIDEMIATGMLIGGADIAEPYDRFRNRVMFPIADTKGRIIAFGGRALDPDAPAKYLNSPETPLFHKGHNLFNAHRAREPAFAKGRVIAVEGYMDAVTLSEAGFPETVAPLGTALTEEQVRLLWRLAPEPILCFDGDSAGRKAAHRAIDTVLPLLEPGKSVTFAFLPDGLDPDDLVRQQGAVALETVLARARPLVDVLFEREWSQGDWSTPERRAALERQLRALVARIPEPAIRTHYGQALFQRLAGAWGNATERGDARRPSRAPFADRHGNRSSRRPDRPAQSTPGTNRGWQPQGRFGSERPSPSASLVNSALVQGEAAPPYREVLILATLLNHPWLVEGHAEELSAVTFTSLAMSRLRDAVLSVAALENPLDSAALRAHLSRCGAGRSVDLVDRTMTHKCDKFAKPEAEHAEVEDGWRHTLELHERQVGLRRSLEAAERQWHEDGSEEAYTRIREIHEQLARLSAPEALDAAGADVVV